MGFAHADKDGAAPSHVLAYSLMLHCPQVKQVDMPKPPKNTMPLKAPSTTAVADVDSVAHPLMKSTTDGIWEEARSFCKQEEELSTIAKSTAEEKEARKSAVAVPPMPQRAPPRISRVESAVAVAGEEVGAQVKQPLVKFDITQHIRLAAETDTRAESRATSIAGDTNDDGAESDTFQTAVAELKPPGPPHDFDIPPHESSHKNEYD